MFFILLLAFCITFETAAPKTFKIVYNDRRPMSYSRWIERCRSVNGRLARIENNADLRAAQRVLAKQRDVHSVILDGHRNGGTKWKTFYYADGTPLRYAKWYPGEPNDFNPGEICIEMFLVMGLFPLWNDCSCTWRKAALCEV